MTFEELPNGAIFVLVDEHGNVKKTRDKFVKKSDKRAIANPPIGEIIISPTMTVQRMDG